MTIRTVNIHQAKTHLSRLIQGAVAGEPFVIAKAGKPLVKVVPIEGRTRAEPKRIGFLAGEIVVPDDFDSIGAAEITELFEDR